jgi:hypothetical protein
MREKGKRCGSGGEVWSAAVPSFSSQLSLVSFALSLLILPVLLSLQPFRFRLVEKKQKLRYQICQRVPFRIITGSGAVLPLSSLPRPMPGLPVPTG